MLALLPFMDGLPPRPLSYRLFPMFGISRRRLSSRFARLVGFWRCASNVVPLFGRAIFFHAVPLAPLPRPCTAGFFWACTPLFGLQS